MVFKKEMILQFVYNIYYFSGRHGKEVQSLTQDQEFSKIFTFIFIFKNIACEKSLACKRPLQYFDFGHHPL